MEHLLTRYYVCKCLELKVARANDSLQLRETTHRFRSVLLLQLLALLLFQRYEKQKHPRFGVKRPADGVRWNLLGARTTELWVTLICSMDHIYNGSVCVCFCE